MEYLQQALTAGCLGSNSRSTPSSATVNELHQSQTIAPRPGYNANLKPPPINSSIPPLNPLPPPPRRGNSRIGPLDVVDSRESDLTPNDRANMPRGQPGGDESRSGDHWSGSAPGAGPTMLRNRITSSERTGSSMGWYGDVARTVER